LICDVIGQQIIELVLALYVNTAWGRMDFSHVEVPPLSLFPGFIQLPLKRILRKLKIREADVGWKVEENPLLGGDFVQSFECGDAAP
jgi:hypothetical protein